MTVGNAIYTRLLAGGYLISGQTNSVEIQFSTNSQDVTPFEATAKEFVTLPPEASITLGGYMTFSASDVGTFEKIAYTALSTADTLGVIKSTSSTYAGNVGFVMPSAYVQQLEQATPTAGVMTVNATWRSSNAGVRRGVCIYSGTVSATGGTTAINLGAAGSAGGYAYLFVTTETGSGSGATIGIESATTAGGTYSSEGTFTFSGIGAYAITLSGAISQYLRLNTTSLGGATSWHVTCIACVAGVTYQ